MAVVAVVKAIIVASGASAAYALASSATREKVKQGVTAAIGMITSFGPDSSKLKSHGILITQSKKCESRYIQGSKGQDCVLIDSSFSTY